MLIDRRNLLRAAGLGLMSLPLAGFAGQIPDSIINQSGPLPVRKSFQTGSVGPAVLGVSGSVWTAKNNTLIGIEVFLDGRSVGAAKIFSNVPNTHRSVVPVHVPIVLDKPFTGPQFDPPTYTIELRPLNADTNADENDWFHVALFAS